MAGGPAAPGVRWARRAGFLLGLALAAAAVLAWRVPVGTGTLGGADLTFSAGPTGELSVDPVGPVLSVRELGPESGPARGHLDVTNRTGRRLAVRVRALPDSRTLDGTVRVELRSGAFVLFRGKLGALRRWTAGALALAPGERRRLELRASIPASAPTGYRGAIETVPLELRARPFGGGA